MAVGIAMGVGAVVSAGLAYAGSKETSSAIRKSGKFNRYAFDRTVELNQPLIDSRDKALEKLNSLFFGGETIDPSTLPGFDFQRQQGEQAIQRAASARGLNQSGRTLKDLIRFNQGLAESGYQSYINPLLSMANLGQIGANSQNNALQNFAQNKMATALAGAENAQSAYNQYGNIINNAFDQYIKYQAATKK